MKPVELTCDRCGELCLNGYQHITQGTPDPATGYQDESCLCAECLDEDAQDALDELRYEAGDMAYDASREPEL